jgi:hypothetical protein
MHEDIGPVDSGLQVGIAMPSEVDLDHPGDAWVRPESVGHANPQCAVCPGEYDGLHPPTMPPCPPIVHPPRPVAVDPA